MEMGYQLHTPTALLPGKEPPVSIGGLVVHIVGPACVMRKIAFHCMESNAGCPAQSPSLYHLSYPSSTLVDTKFSCLLGHVILNFYNLRFHYNLQHKRYLHTEIINF
jgi:hypothetical protein